MPQNTSADPAVRTTYFDPELALRIWKPFNKPEGDKHLFLLDNVERGTRLHIHVWGAFGPNPPKWRPWGVHVDIEMLDPEELKCGRHEHLYHLAHVATSIHIQDVEYNEVKRYVQFNLQETEESAKAPNLWALRIFDCGYLVYAGGLNSGK